MKNKMILAIVSFRIKIKGSPNSRSSKIKRKFLTSQKIFFLFCLNLDLTRQKLNLAAFFCVVIDRDSFSSSAPWTYTTHAAGITGASWDRKNLNTASRSMLRRQRSTIIFGDFFAVGQTAIHTEGIVLSCYDLTKFQFGPVFHNFRERFSLSFLTEVTTWNIGG